VCRPSSLAGESGTHSRRRPQSDARSDQTPRGAPALRHMICWTNAITPLAGRGSDAVVASLFLVRHTASMGRDLHDDLLKLVPPDLMERSGRVFYSGRAAFTRPAPLYLLGLNPGGDPIQQAMETIGSCVEQSASRPFEWSAYVDEAWRGRAPGSKPLQRRVQHLLRQAGLDPHRVPAANVVFVRSRRESELAAEKAHLLDACWPVHAALISTLGVKVIACLGGTAGRWVGERLGALELVDTFTEANDRRWTSHTHANGDGLKVVTLTHPSIADWCAPATDPTALVTRALGQTATVNGHEHLGTC
jgi:hypothetical protein